MIASRVRSRLLRLGADRQLVRQVERVEASLRGDGSAGGRPVLFFNASTRIHHLSLNAAYSLLASWAVRGASVPVGYLVCQRGLDPCVLGTNRDDYGAHPPCSSCLPLSGRLYPRDRVTPLTYGASLVSQVGSELAERSLAELGAWSHRDLPLGELCLPGLRWALRRHNLPDDHRTRGLFRRYLTSAASLASQVERALRALRPRCLVVFNGIMYPEAIARSVALRQDIPVITHEVGLRPLSAFFSHEHATFRQIEFPPDFALGEEENRRLDGYLEERFQGRFTMAGIRFWPEMQALPEWLGQRMAGHDQTVAVFTNVIFDTSQIHANSLYPEMFAWLEDVQAAIEAHPETLFILRAHPDEDRPGKESRESVASWVRERRLSERPNVVFLPPSERVSSYELIRRAKLTLVYNSSVGLEASILGMPVLCAARARYTQVPTVFYPTDRQAYLSQLKDFLGAAEISVPSEFAVNARRFLYFELYTASIDLSAFLEPYPDVPGFVTFSGFDPSMVLGKDHAGLQAIREGILEGKSFCYP